MEHQGRSPSLLRDQDHDVAKLIFDGTVVAPGVPKIAYQFPDGTYVDSAMDARHDPTQ
ncbi:hypothetical protein [Mesorhizobium sp.]|uniref:hypothetical protein n=1 Tax=Mesorhizobium sp. TaxID=1871066 RepID=UPI0025C41448|nr:hypothetical protein [Mesorhizobium sp.]